MRQAQTLLNNLFTDSEKPIKSVFHQKNLTFVYYRLYYCVIKGNDKKQTTIILKKLLSLIKHK